MRTSCLDGSNKINRNCSKAIELRNPEVLGPYATRIVVRANEAKDMDFIATRAGSYELTCADHDWAGMTARITVE